MIRSYLAGFLTFLLVDTLWIQLFVKKTYLKYLHDILLINNNQLSARLLPAILFYILFYNCLFYLSVIKTNSFKEALISSVVIGFITYGTYSFTNMAVIKDWNWTLTLSDLMWGPVLTLITTAVAKKLQQL